MENNENQDQYRLIQKLWAGNSMVGNAKFWEALNDKERVFLVTEILPFDPSEPPFLTTFRENHALENANKPPIPTESPLAFRSILQDEVTPQNPLRRILQRFNPKRIFRLTYKSN